MERHPRMARAELAGLVALLAISPAAGTQESAPGESSVPKRPTFTEHVAPILFANCTACHRAGESAPFPLVTYRDTKKRAGTIQRVTESRYMPPWHVEEGWGDFHDPRRLTDNEIETIARWVECGLSEGPATALPPLPAFVEGWQLGEPDLVVEMPVGFRVPASGPDLYRNFVVPLGLSEDAWVQAIEVRPSAGAVLHHTLIFADDTGQALRLQAEDESEQPGFQRMSLRGSSQLAAWAVGGTARRLPSGLARPLKRASTIVLSSHFHPSGKEELEKTRLGLFFAREAPQRTVLDFQVPPQYGAYWGIDIPAGEAAYVVEDQFVVPCDIELVGVWGHAHYLCTSMRATARLPDGRLERLISIPSWDFDWQNAYLYRVPVRLPRGTVIEARITYDNSAENPGNPADPPRRVRWGLEATDEMGSLIFTCATVEESQVESFRSGHRKELRQSVVRAERRGLLARQDFNRDGELARKELPRRFRSKAEKFDVDGDGVLRDEELDNFARYLSRQSKESKERGRRGGQDER